MKAMYSHWFQHRDGSLKTLRISVVVFVAVLVGLGVIREATRSGEALRVQVSHVFEPETAQSEPETAQKGAETAQKEPETAPQAPAPEPREKVEKPVPEKTAAVAEAAPEKPGLEPENAAVPEKSFETALQNDLPAASMPVETVEQKFEPEIVQAAAGQGAIQVEDIRPEADGPEENMPEAVGPADAMFAQIVQEEMGQPAGQTSEHALEKTVPEEPGVEKKALEETEQEALAPVFAEQAPAVKKKTVSLAKDMEEWLGKKRADSGPGPENKAMKREPLDLQVSLPGAKRPGQAGNGIELASEEYMAVYEKWRRSGEALDSDKQGMSLRIMDLEQVYDLFQMKVVAFRGQTPFMDLTDNTRVAPQSLDDYSGTCFVVARPWDKWGDALSRAGFRKTDALEVRYYTYDFVRNAIFARAARAVAWSSAAGLPADADLSRADVLGRAYGMNRSGGGAFGVFVPVQVDFGSGMSVTVDPLACFPDEPDILALNRAGLL